MKIITPQEAERLRYREITNAIAPVAEDFIVRSIESTMSGCDAVWVSDDPRDPKSPLRAARRNHEIKTTAKRK